MINKFAISIHFNFSNLPIIKSTLKQLSNDDPTTNLARQKLQKLSQNAVLTEAMKPTALQATNAGILP